MHQRIWWVPWNHEMVTAGQHWCVCFETQWNWKWCYEIPLRRIIIWTFWDMRFGWYMYIHMHMYMYIYMYIYICICTIPSEACHGWGVSHITSKNGLCHTCERICLVQPIAFGDTVSFNPEPHLRIQSHFIIFSSEIRQNTDPCVPMTFFQVRFAQHWSAKDLHWHCFKSDLPNAICQGSLSSVRINDETLKKWLRKRDQRLTLTFFQVRSAKHNLSRVSFKFANQRNTANETWRTKSKMKIWDWKNCTTIGCTSRNSNRWSEASTASQYMCVHIYTYMYTYIYIYTYRFTY